MSQSNYFKPRSEQKNIFLCLHTYFTVECSLSEQLNRNQNVISTFTKFQPKAQARLFTYIISFKTHNKKS